MRQRSRWDAVRVTWRDAPVGGSERKAAGVRPHRSPAVDQQKASFSFLSGCWVESGGGETRFRLPNWLFGRDGAVRGRGVTRKCSRILALTSTTRTRFQPTEPIARVFFFYRLDGRDVSLPIGRPSSRSNAPMVARAVFSKIFIIFVYILMAKSSVNV